MGSRFACAIGVALLAGAPIFAHAIDSDNDGIKDRRDTCASTPVGARVDRNGCPIDSDADGVPDGIDQCSRTPSGWPVDEHGCPRDSDRDGVVDAQDSCQATPQGATVDSRGCPSDSDGDQVLDGLDRCSGTPAGYRVDGFGCPVDSDHDGVNDALDKCADTKPMASVDADGCALKAPPLFGPEGGKVRLPGEGFETGKVELTPESAQALLDAANSLKDWPDVRVEIAVHTDRKGAAAANRELSQRQANFVRNYLEAAGVEPSRLQAKGYGEKAEKGAVAEKAVDLVKID